MSRRFGGSSAHARERAKERYAIKLTNKVSRELANAIVEGKCKLLQRQSDGRSIYLVEWRGSLVPIVWCRIDCLVVTVLPWSAVHCFPEVASYFKARKQTYNRSKNKRKYWSRRRPWSSDRLEREKKRRKLNRSLEDDDDATEFI